MGNIYVVLISSSDMTASYLSSPSWYKSLSSTCRNKTVPRNHLVFNLETIIDQ